MSPAPNQGWTGPPRKTDQTQAAAPREPTGQGWTAAPREPTSRAPAATPRETGQAPAAAPREPTNQGWTGARREIAVAALLVVALAGAAWALDGPAAAAVVVLGSAAVALVLLRPLIDQGEDALPPPVAYPDRPAQTFHGFWRTQADLADASRSLAAWDLGARGRLTNLFAARLAERHGISLDADPQAARRLLLRVPSRHDLWFWIDPGRPTPRNADSRPGIPPHVLATLIDRLEKL